MDSMFKADGNLRGSVKSDIIPVDTNKGGDALIRNDRRQIESLLSYKQEAD